MKVCPKCSKEKEDSEFYVQKSGRHKGKLTSWCKSCCSERSAKRYRENPEKCKEEHKKWVAKNKDKVALAKAKSAYGITEEEYNSLKRVCQICGSTENLVIDHSHQSGRIRGMLCNSCNKGLGFFKDNPALLDRASNYVLGKHIEIETPDIFHQTYDQVSDIELNSDEPLTVEELRQMNGQPVWCADLNEWGIVKIETIGRWANTVFLIGHYGNDEVRTNFEVDIVRREYKCYRNPQKGAEK